MRIDLSKTSHVLFFIVFLPAISLGIGWAFAQLIPDSAPFWLDTISPLGAYALLYSFFDNIAWHWPIFRWLDIVDAPDLRGRWAGEQLSSYKDKNGNPTRSYVVLEIEQSFSGVSAHAHYKRWDDDHRASCFLEIDGELYLVGLFESEPNAKHDGKDRAHKGVVRLRYVPTDKMLIGHYFNNFGNYGEVRLKHQGMRLYHRFDKGA